jgi:hypothetical protein
LASIFAAAGVVSDFFRDRVVDDFSVVFFAVSFFVVDFAVDLEADFAVDFAEVDLVDFADDFVDLAADLVPEADSASLTTAVTVSDCSLAVAAAVFDRLVDVVDRRLLELRDRLGAAASAAVTTTVTPSLLRLRRN